MTASLIARLTEMADRRAKVMSTLEQHAPADVVAMARQDVADLREAARLLGGRVH